MAVVMVRANEAYGKAPVSSFDAKKVVNMVVHQFPLLTVPQTEEG